MSDKPRNDREEASDPSKLDAQRKAVDAESRRDAASLREQPEDRSETARRTTPAGKGRSK